MRQIDVAAMKELSSNSKEAKEKVQRMKDSVKGGSMKLCAFAMLDPDFHREVFTSVFRTMHKTLESLLSNGVNARQFHIDIVLRRGPFWRAMASALSPYTRIKELLKIGIIGEVHSRGGPLWDDDHVTRLEQRDLATKLWRRNIDQFRNFLKGFNHYYDGYPSSFASLLDGHPVDVGLRWYQMKADFAAHLEASTWKVPRLKKITARSMFNWTENREVFEEDAVGIVIENATRILTYTADTTLLEKSFAASADQETNTANKRLSAPSMWHYLAKKKLLTQDFAFPQEVTVADVPNDQPAHAALPGSIFKPSARKLSIDASDLSTRKATGDWETMNSEGWHQLVPEAKLVRYLFDHRAFNRSQDAWRTDLVVHGLIFSIANRPGQLFYSMYKCSAVHVSWRVERIRIGPDAYFVFGQTRPDLPIYEPVLDFEEWWVVPHEACSLLDMLVSNKGLAFDVIPEAFARQSSDAIPYLRFAAQNGFFSL